MGFKAIFAFAIMMTCDIAMWIVLCKCYVPIFSKIAFEIAIAVCERTFTPFGQRTSNVIISEINLKMKKVSFIFNSSKFIYNYK